MWKAFLDVDSFVEARLCFSSDMGPEHQTFWLRNKETLEFLGSLQIADAVENAHDGAIDLKPGFAHHEAASELLQFHGCSMHAFVCRRKPKHSKVKLLYCRKEKTVKIDANTTSLDTGHHWTGHD